MYHAWIVTSDGKERNLAITASSVDGAFEFLEKYLKLKRLHLSGGYLFEMEHDGHTEFFTRR